MELKKTGSSGSRHTFRIRKSLLSDSVRIKYLNTRLLKKSGRNSRGVITIRHRGGGNKKIFRLLALGAENFRGIVLSIEYDPYRSSFISCVFDLERKIFLYVLTIHNVFPGSIIECGGNVDPKLGNRVQLSSLPSGSIISNVSKSFSTAGVFARSAGTSCQLIQKGSRFSQVRIPSGKIVSLNSSAYANVGVISNPLHRLEVIGKAGLNRHRGFRPGVRGVAMNPVDHPHGGGEGKTSGGRPSVTPWGKPTKGKPTRKNVKV
jgi:large subunit ribosomal protein L2